MESGHQVDGACVKKITVLRKLATLSFRQALLSILPGPLRSAIRPWWRRFFRFKLRARGWMPFTVWLVFQCAWHRKRAVLICRFGGIGDVVCTLPMCGEVRHRHPGKLLVFVTATVWRDLVILSRSADLVYANRSWVYPFTMPTNVTLFGLVDTVYNPQTTGELTGAGEACHLIDDLAASCGFKVTARQPRLYPSPSLIRKTRIACGLAEDVVGNRLIIGINGGPSWRVREWEFSKWQKLINKIHSEYDAVIIQFGSIAADGFSEHESPRGVQSVASRVKGKEGVALIAICDLIITIDSGPVHLAGTVGTPVIGLFGPTNPALRLPPDSPRLGLAGDVPCLFCHHQTPHGHWFSGCPNDIACMKKLDEQTVFEAVKSMLGQSNKRLVKESFAEFD
jgi:ADP-heptose:LPS heptosyltransferase